MLLGSYAPLGNTGVAASPPRRAGPADEDDGADGASCALPAPGLGSTEQS